MLEETVTLLNEKARNDNLQVSGQGEVEVTLENVLFPNYDTFYLLVGHKTTKCRLVVHELIYTAIYVVRI
jgi:hypothetical protein